MSREMCTILRMRELKGWRDEYVKGGLKQAVEECDETSSCVGSCNSSPNTRRGSGWQRRRLAVHSRGQDSPWCVQPYMALWETPGQIWSPQADGPTYKKRSTHTHAEAKEKEPHRQKTENGVQATLSCWTAVMAKLWRREHCGKGVFLFRFVF